MMISNSGKGFLLWGASQLALVVRNAGDIRDSGSILGSGSFPGEGHIFLPKESPWTEEPSGLQSMGLQRIGPH